MLGDVKGPVLTGVDDPNIPDGVVKHWLRLRVPAEVRQLWVDVHNAGELVHQGACNVCEELVSTGEALEHALNHVAEDVRPLARMVLQLPVSSRKTLLGLFDKNGEAKVGAVKNP